MDVFQSDRLDPGFISDLLETTNEQYRISESMLFELDRYPENNQLVHALRQSVGTIKANLLVAGFYPLAQVITSTEKLLILLDREVLQFSPIISDLVLLVLDRVRRMVDEFCRKRLVRFDQSWLNELSKKIDNVSQSRGFEQQELVAQAIRMLDPAVIVTLDRNASDKQKIESDSFLEHVGFEDDKDVQFFRDLMEPVEKRSQYWLGRGDRILKMVLLLNKLGGSPIDKHQLAVAVYVHDFGMAFMPVELLHKESFLLDSEIMLLRSHVQSSVHLLAHMPKWACAKEIVLQHHEAVNGSGYPFGLQDKEICDGAKILAIADTFDALTHQRAYVSHQKRPIIRAVGEINACAGQQLCKHWVDVFNHAVQPVINAHRINRSYL
ncbi:MAG: HD-GYP domain-containing protein (c-di-GMP phosphodiesterase class II) [Gammaproteobacteria bacterium]|jgi:HD-GYP domain-containing protein (c-di-GMP phosphodiesterase class II)